MRDAVSGAAGSKARGQSLVEYLLVAIALVTMIMAVVKPLIDAKATSLMGQAMNQVTNPSATADAIIPSIR